MWQVNLWYNKKLYEDQKISSVNISTLLYLGLWSVRGGVLWENFTLKDLYFTNHFCQPQILRLHGRNVIFTFFGLIRYFLMYDLETKLGSYPYSSNRRLFVLIVLPKKDISQLPTLFTPWAMILQWWLNESDWW